MAPEAAPRCEFGGEYQQEYADLVKLFSVVLGIEIERAERLARICVLENMKLDGKHAEFTYTEVDHE